ncbi:alpha/beta hydrolase [Micromonospora sp. KC213]|uniref:alpha/beta fold hydrolase n=1 Tax=Micromonospora sp. KC213 TaxID=2530378 RepID=UPI0010536C99|nr:alpha/beta hydrolase [Micromonospora sp. KC213]TDC39229.1 alpha/beta hydrolase [Micromonospora sp. KC213]
MEVRYARLPGLRMAYRSWGPPDARPVVALHGGSVAGQTWAGLAVALGDQAHLCAPDLRGFGGTDRPGAYSLELMCGDVRALLDVLGLARVTLIGHSVGAVVAYLLAQAHPDRVAALVLAEPPPPVPVGLRLPPRPTGPLDYDWAAREAVVGQLNDPDPVWWERMAAITAPTLVVAGGPASHLPQDRVAAVAGRIPGARLVTIDAGHAVHATRPDEFHAVVREFLADADAD